MKYLEILQECGVMKTPRADGEIHTNCPMHSDAGPSFDINADSGLWICRSECGPGNIYLLVANVLGMPIREAINYVRSRVGDETMTVDQLTEEIEKMVEMIENLSARQMKKIDKPYILDTSGLVRDHWPTWWPQRGFNTEDWHRWSVWFDPTKGDAVLPVIDYEGVMRGEVRRRPPGSIPKYMYPDISLFPKSQYLYGESEARGFEHVFIVEGSLDAIWMWHCDSPAVSILGSMISQAQYWRLVKMGVRSATMVLDGDKGGITGMRWAIDQGLASGFDFVLLPEGKDPQDIKDPEELKQILNNRISAFELKVKTPEYENPRQRTRSR